MQPTQVTFFSKKQKTEEAATTPPEFVIAFDFDETITDEHTRGFQLKADLNSDREILNNVREPKTIKQTIINANNKNIGLAIATKGDKSDILNYLVKKLKANPEDYFIGETLVKLYLKAILKDDAELIDKINIQAFMEKNKNPHLKNIQAKFGVASQQILLLDNELNNVVQAREAGFIAIFITPQNWAQVLADVNAVINGQMKLVELHDKYAAEEPKKQTQNKMEDSPKKQQDKKISQNYEESRESQEESEEENSESEYSRSSQNSNN